MTNKFRVIFQNFVKMSRPKSVAKIVQLIALIQFISLSFVVFILKTILFGRNGGPSRTGNH